MSPSPRMVTVPLLGAVLLALGIFPAPGGYDLEWFVGVVGAFCFLLLSVGTLELVSRRPWFESASPLMQVGLSLAAVAALAAGLVFTIWAAQPGLLAYTGEAPPSLTEAVGTALFSAVAGYASWVMAFRYPELLRRAAVRDLETERLRLQADEVEREARLAPHFLLNTLNAIAGLVHRDPAAAQEVISALGTLLRASLYERPGVGHTLGAELEALESYAAIMKARYGSRLAFEFEAEPELLEYPVPQLLLQPLLENAVKHGALRVRDGGPIRLEAARTEAGALKVELRNAAPAEDAPSEGGEGLRLVRARLALLDPPGRLDTVRGAEGFRAVVELGRVRRSP